MTRRPRVIVRIPPNLFLSGSPASATERWTERTLEFDADDGQAQRPWIVYYGRRLRVVRARGTWEATGFVR